MANHRRQALAKAFNNDPELQQLVLTDVTPTGKILGSGSFGSVEEVLYNNITCAGKKLHQHATEGVDDILEKYLKEGQLMSSLIHPNIIQFHGLCFLGDHLLPLMVMEQLDRSLDVFLNKPDIITLSRKCSVLEDVASGLLYLHDRPSPVIHRDLTAKNVLLTSSLVAKITDMGNSRIMEPNKMAMTLSKQSGTKAYMPPEALDNAHRYGPSLDIFSFGHLTLYVILQKFPDDLLPRTYCNPDNVDDTQGRSEVERRSEYFRCLTTILDAFHQAGNTLALVVKRCLHNVPEERPGSAELLAKLQEFKRIVEGAKPEVLQEDLQLKLQRREAEITQLRDELKSSQAKPTFQFSCRQSLDMPFVMGNYVQSVLVRGTIYIGGGDADASNPNEYDYKVMKYKAAINRWDTIICPDCYFTMTAINNELVLVGGYNKGQRSSKLCVWRAGAQKKYEWKQPYQEMSIARDRCSAIVHNGWLVVAGGWSKADDGHALSSVEVMNIANRQWYNGPPTPIPWVGMRVACVNGVCYFMGGYSSNEGTITTNRVYCASLTALTEASSSETWTQIAPLPLNYCTPISFSGCLLAVGGEVKKYDDSNLIRLYQPDSRTWVGVGELCSPRSKCTSTLLEDGRIIVAGGNHNGTFLKTMEIYALTPFCQ